MMHHPPSTIHHLSHFFPTPVFPSFSRTIRSDLLSYYQPSQLVKLVSFSALLLQNRLRLSAAAN